MSTIKYSRQRESILNYLKGTTSHPTADQVYETVRKSFPRISLGTVYRNLKLLSEQGLILKLNCGHDCERFDGNPSLHYHFICTSCHNVLDLNMDSLDHINTLAAFRFNGQIEGHIAYFYGTCENCKKIRAT